VSIFSYYNPTFNQEVKMERALSLTTEILGGRTYPFGYVTGEVLELAEALWQRDAAGIREEFADAAYAAQMWLWQRLRINAPVVCAGFALTKFRSRNRVWRTLFEDEGIVFTVDYLVGGSNFAKSSKIAAAFAVAGVTLSPSKLDELSRKASQLCDN